MAAVAPLPLSAPISQWEPADVAAWFQSVDAAVLFTTKGEGYASSALAHGVTGADLLTLCDDDSTDELREAILEKCGVKGMSAASRVAKAVGALVQQQQQQVQQAPEHPGGDGGTTPQQQPPPAVLRREDSKRARRRSRGFELGKNAAALAAPAKLPVHFVGQLLAHGFAAAALVFGIYAAPQTELLLGKQFDLDKATRLREKPPLRRWAQPS